MTDDASTTELETELLAIRAQAGAQSYLTHKAHESHARSDSRLLRLFVASVALVSLSLGFISGVSYAHGKSPLLARYAGCRSYSRGYSDGHYVDAR